MNIRSSCMISMSDGWMGLPGEANPPSPKEENELILSKNSRYLPINQSACFLISTKASI